MPDYQATFTAIANFSSLASEARKAREEIRQLKAEAESVDRVASNLSSSGSVIARRTNSLSLESEARASASATRALVEHAAAARLDAAATLSDAKAHDALARSSASALGPARAMVSQMVQMQSARRALTTTDREASDVLRIHSTRLQDHVRVIDQNGNAVRRQSADYRSAGRELETFDNKLTRSTHDMAEYGVTVRAVAQQMLSYRSVARDISRVSPPHLPTIYSGGGGDGGSAVSSALGGGSGGGSPPGLKELSSGAGDAENAMGRLYSVASKFPALMGLIGSSIGPVISGVGGLAGGAIGLANSLSSLIGVGAALPGMLAAVGAGLGSVIIGMLPLAKAFQAYQKVQDATSTSSRDVADSQDRLAKAEISHAQAQRSVERAQVSLNDARKQALRDLVNLRIEVSRAGLKEEGAIANLRQAQDAYQQTLADTQATEADRASALYKVHQAEADLADVRKKNTQNTQDLASAEQKGVEGSDKVVSAKEALTNAQMQLTQSTKDLAQAQTDLANGGQAVAKAQQALNDILAKMTPSQRAFTVGLIGMKGALNAIADSVGTALFAPLVGQLGNIRSLLPVVNRILTDTAGVMGVLAKRGIEMVSSGPWRSDFLAQSKDNVTILSNLGSAGLSLADALRNVTRAAGPFTVAISNDIRQGAAFVATLAASARSSGALATWLELVHRRTMQWFDILKNLVVTLFNFNQASNNFGDWVLTNLDKVTTGWRRVSEEQRRAGSPFQQWLENIKPLLEALGHLVGVFAGGVAEIASDPTNIQTMTKALRILADDVLPHLVKIVDDLGKNGVANQVLTTFGLFMQSFQKFMDSGGQGALSSFFTVFTQVSTAILKVLSWGPVPHILGAVATAFGAFSAVVIIGKFTGLFALVGALEKLVKLGPSLRNFKLPGFGGTGGFLGGTAATAGGALGNAAEEASGFRTLALAGTELQAAAAALTRAAGELGLSGLSGGKGVGVAEKTAARTATEAATGIGAAKVATTAEATTIAAKVGRLARLADPLLWAGLAAGIGADFMGSGRGKSYVGGAGAVLTGAGTGATIGSIVPGVGTAVGAGVGAVAGAAWSAFRDPRIRRDFEQYIVNPVKSFFTGIIPRAASSAWSAVHHGLITPVANFFTKDGPRDVSRFFSGLPRTMVKAESDIVGTFLGVTDRVESLFTHSVPRWFMNVRGYFNRQVSSPVSNWVAGLPNFFTRSVPHWFAGVPAWFNTQVARPVGTWVAGLPRFFASTVPAFFANTWTWFRRQVADPIGKWLTAIPNAIGSAFSWVGSLFGIDSAEVSSQRKRIAGRADGGSLPEGLAWVGERGRELAIKRGSDVQIVPHHQIPGFADGTGFDFGTTAALGYGTSSLHSVSGLRPSTTNNSSVTNSGVTVEKIEINNPAPERASDSIRRTLQKATYFGREGK